MMKKKVTDFRKMLGTGVDPRLPIKRPPSTKGPVIKLRNNCRKELEIEPLLSGFGHSLASF